MDKVIKDCTKIQKTLIDKYNLDYFQEETLNHAITQYDYEQNNGMIFTDQFAIMELFLSSEEPEPDEDDIYLISYRSPTLNCVFALCEYIIQTIKYYDIGGFNSNASEVAKSILKKKGGKII